MDSHAANSINDFIFKGYYPLAKKYLPSCQKGLDSGLLLDI